ncbi:MAG: hypothetical protein N3C12_15005 [Candidatus Binatia bacterium]|nr:hypothetical protein [Candidatus Binatia bacterium]
MAVSHGFASKPWVAEFALLDPAGEPIFLPVRMATHPTLFAASRSEQVQRMAGRGKVQAVRDVGAPHLPRATPRLRR